MKNKKILFAVITAVLTVIMSVAFTGCEKKKENKTTEFDFKEYANFTFTGYNHYGEASMKLNKIDNIPRDFYENMKCTGYNENNDIVITWDSNFVFGAIKNKEELTNDEELALVFTWDEDYAKEHNINVVNSEFTVNVEGLEPTTDFTAEDIFKDVTIECKTTYFSDIELKACNYNQNYRNDIYVITDSCDSKIDYHFNFYEKENNGSGRGTIDYKIDFQNGDTVTICAKCNKFMISTQGIYITDGKLNENGAIILEKDFVCSGFDDIE